MKINEKGYWENETDEGHGHDPKLAKAIINFFYKERRNHTWGILKIIDIGCGDGYYTYMLVKHGLMCIGYDGNPNTYNISTKKYGVACYQIDFTEYLDWEFDEGEDYDWAICLEVGEHIPEKYEQIFLDNIQFLVRDGIILSWAIEGQGGDGHVNCRNNDYIISEMNKRDFYLDEKYTHLLRDLCSPYPETGWWFKNSLMVFRSKHE